MDVPATLRLRKNDSEILLSLKHHEIQKVHKRQNIRDILIRDFYRKFDISSNLHRYKNSEQSLFIAQETDKFLKLNSQSVNSNDLKKFQRQLAAKLQWIPGQNLLVERGSQSTVKLPQIIQSLSPQVKQGAFKVSPQTNLSLSRFEDIKNQKPDFETDGVYTSIVNGQNATQKSLLLRVENFKNESPYGQTAVDGQSQRFAKVIPFHRSKTVEDFVSNISIDEWGEVQKYGKLLDQELREKEKQDLVAKKMQVRRTLDAQIKQQMQLKELQKKEKFDSDQQLLDYDAREMEKDKYRKDSMQLRALQAKVMQSQMFADASSKKAIERQEAKMKEKIEVDKLRQEMENERQSQQKKKNQEREQARLLLEENENERKKRLQSLQELQQKEEEQNIQERKVKEQNQKRREQVALEREKKLQQIMSRMGDVLITQDREKQRKAELDYLNQCQARDERANQQELLAKLKKQKELQEVRRFLDNQVSEKLTRKRSDSESTTAFIQQLKEKQLQEEREEQLKQQKLKQIEQQNAQFLLNQMTKPTTTSDSKLMRKHVLGGMMAQEEIRMNKALLQEIARKKRSQDKSNSVSPLKDY